MLKFLVFLGSARDSTPPRPARHGLRVARQCEGHLQSLGHDIELIDPLSIDLPPIFKPHFSYTKGAAAEAGGFPGTVDAQAWRGYVGRTLSQLEGWAAAARARRGPLKAFPAQRPPSRRTRLRATRLETCRPRRIAL